MASRRLPKQQECNLELQNIKENEMQLAKQVSGGRFEVGDNSISIGAAYDFIMKNTRVETMKALSIDVKQYAAFERLVCKKLAIPAWRKTELRSQAMYGSV